MPNLTLVEKGSGKTHHADSEVLVGRDPSCGIFLEGDQAKTVSGRHARFYLDDTRWYVEDAGSRNGTYIGTRKLDPGTRHALSVGDVIGLGLTGTQLLVQEVAGRAFAATMIEPTPAVPNPVTRGTVPQPRADASRAGSHDSGGGEVRLVLRNVETGIKSVGQGAPVTIGRALECLIRVEGEAATSVSRVHAEVSVANGKIQLRDGGSRHGTFVNGRKTDGAVPVKAGDVLMLGSGGPTFAIDDVLIVPISATPPDSPAAPRITSVAHTGVRNAAGKSSSTPSHQSPANEASDEVFISELPTPALERPAAGKSRPSPAKKTSASGTVARLARASSSIGRAAMRNLLDQDSQGRAKRARLLVAGGVGVVVIAAVVVMARQKVGRTDGGESGGGANIDVRQQAEQAESLRAAVITEAVTARAILDSALHAGAASAVMDSLRQVVNEADGRAARIQDSLKRAKATGQP